MKIKMITHILIQVVYEGGDPFLFRNMTWISSEQSSPSLKKCNELCTRFLFSLVEINHGYLMLYVVGIL